MNININAVGNGSVVSVTPFKGDIKTYVVESSENKSYVDRILKIVTDNIKAEYAYYTYKE